MSGTTVILRGVVPLLAVLLATAGCEKARPYNPDGPGKASVRSKLDRRTDSAQTAQDALPESFAWMDVGREPIQANDVRIEFVHEATRPDEWKQLSSYFNDSTVAKAVGVMGLPGFGAAALAADKRGPVITIKVPLGLDDPSAHVPAANPLTKNKWELGRKLFFDPNWLTATTHQSCSTCHRPDRGFSDGDTHTEGSYNVPTLVNVVFNSRQFWDGRATYLEEVVQRTLLDEREPAEALPFNHVWHGVIGRLRASGSWTDEFNRVFGVAPTQDTVGKAIATYLRTLLAGNSVHDRAVQVQKKKAARTLLAEHYEAVLDDEAMAGLGRVKEAKAKAAEQLKRGHDLFHGKAGCAACHPASNGHFTDGRFYNVGVESERIDSATNARLGRFAVAPLGEKTRYLKGAYKVPTLRSLSRSWPYFHDGSAADLVAAVRVHVKPPARDVPINLYLDPKLAGPNGEHRDLGLSEQDVADLVLWLRSLDGDEVDRSVRTGPKR